MIPALLGLIGQVAGSIAQNQQNQRLNEQNKYHEQQLLGMQHQYNEAEAANADRRTRALYNDLQSPAAIKQQLKEAGLSIGLMYGNGGMGGQMTSGAQGAGVNPTNRGTIGMTNVMDGIAGQAAQLELIDAQKENIKADTEKKQAEAKSTWKDLPLKEKQLIIMENQVEEIQQRIKESRQRVDNLIEERKQTIANTDKIKSEKERNDKLNELTQAQKEYQEAQTELLKIKLKYADLNEQTAIKEMQASIKKMNAAAKKMGLETEVIEKTKEDIAKKYMLEVAMLEYEKDNIQPEQLNKLKKEINELEQRGFKEFNQSESEAQKRRFYEGFGNGAGFVKVLIEDLFPF